MTDIAGPLDFVVDEVESIVNQRPPGYKYNPVPIPSTALDRPEVAVSFWSRVDRKSADAKQTGCWLWTGSTLPNGYGLHGEKKRYVHRTAYATQVAEIPDNHVIDHLCGRRNCVNPEHLRAVTQKQNLEHRSAPSPLNKSGFRGVSFCSSHGKWRGTVGHNGRHHHAGWFATAEEADAAVRAMRDAHFTDHEGGELVHRRTA